MLWQGEDQFTVNRQYGPNAPVQTGRFGSSRNRLFLALNEIDKEFRLLNLEIGQIGANLHGQLIQSDIFPVVNQRVPMGS
jgi:hypothetical protein